MIKVRFHQVHVGFIFNEMISAFCSCMSKEETFAKIFVKIELTALFGKHESGYFSKTQEFK
ncbi:hypothetical protein Ahy_A07g031216 isoform E [Arachis hypogaea]|uniref:Uncharacterized protein n=1 Tax=Arachis hypogaea TaxID=3818 RepID=A0A445C372_ARAHY|nr:hypothetical protein Ahy_A07g031216 isoform E [Arachis hypogaea]